MFLFVRSSTKFTRWGRSRPSHVGLASDVLQAVPAHCVSRMALEGRRLTARNFEQMRLGRRYTTLAAFLLEMEMALTDTAIAMLRS